ncbi:hypothetical protein EDD11_003952, partial [Mortierella claussenii]
MSLVKIGLAKDYETAIALTPVEERTWEKAIEALHKSIKFESVSSKVADIVTMMRPERGETMRSFSDRLLPLMEAANMDDTDCSWLVKSLGCYLSDVGMQATMNKYKSLDKIKSIRAYLEFLHETPGAVEGNRTDHTTWFLSQFKADISTSISGQERAPKRTYSGNNYDSTPTLKRSKSQSSTFSSRSGNSSSSSTDCHYTQKCKDAMKPHHYKQCYHRKADAKKRALGQSSDSRRSRSRSPKRQDSRNWQDRSQNDYRDRRPENNGRNNFGKDRHDDKNKVKRQDDRTQRPHNTSYKAVNAFHKNDDVHMRDIEFDNEDHRANYLRPKDLKNIYGLKKPLPGDNRLSVPCMINGIMCTALLDPGATISLISRELAQDADIRFGALPDEFVALIKTGTDVPDYVTCDR